MNPPPPDAPPEADMADKAAFKPERTHEVALALPLVGAALFTPPLIGFFTADASLFGVPVIVAYLFSAWLGLIICAYLLSRRLRRAAPEREGGEGDA